MFLIDLKDPYFQIPVHLESLVWSRGVCLPVLCSVLQPVHGLASVHQHLRSDFGVSAPEGCVPPLLSGQLDGHY